MSSEDHCPASPPDHRGNRRGCGCWQSLLASLAPSLLRHGAKLRRRPESEPKAYGVVCLNFDADGGELGVGSGQGDVGVGDDWAGGDMGVM